MLTLQLRNPADTTCTKWSRLVSPVIRDMDIRSSLTQCTEKGTAWLLCVPRANHEKASDKPKMRNIVPKKQNLGMLRSWKTRTEWGTVTEEETNNMTTNVMWNFGLNPGTEKKNTARNTSEIWIRFVL